MNYRRFQLPKKSANVATVATNATELAHDAGPVAAVAIVATLPDPEFEVRTAIVEHDGQRVPRAWAEGFASLSLSRPPLGFTPARWQQVLDDGGRFLDRWAEVALTRGWSATDVFGVNPVAPAGQVRRHGPCPIGSRRRSRRRFHQPRDHPRAQRQLPHLLPAGPTANRGRRMGARSYRWRMRPETMFSRGRCRSSSRSPIVSVTRCRGDADRRFPVTPDSSLHSAIIRCWEGYSAWCRSSEAMPCAEPSSASERDDPDELRRRIDP